MDGEAGENPARSRHSEEILDFRFAILDWSLAYGSIQNPKSKIQNRKVWNQPRSFLAETVSRQDVWLS
jgi:hypothetical protein